MSLALALERSLAPLDQARRAWFRVVQHSRLLSTLLARRESRLALIVAVHAPLALGLAIYFPVPLFVLGPLVFGVVHVAADVRYLILRRALPTWWRRVIAAFSGAFVALGALDASALWRTRPRLELVLATLFALFAVVAATLPGARPAPGGARARRKDGGKSSRAGIASASFIALGAAGWLWPETARLVLLHAHNLVAFLILFLLFPSRKRRLLIPLAVVGGLALTLASGVFYRVSLAGVGVTAFHVHLFEVADWVAPGLRADVAIGVTTAYLFLQSAHYLVGLVLIPQREQRTQGTLTFRMSFRGLLRDFGARGLALVVLLISLVLLGAAFDAPRAQGVYLSLGMFHAYLELAMLGYFWVRAEARH
jgi:hypothetical protein